MIDLDELETLTYDEWIEDNGTVIERAEAIGLLIRRVRQVEAERDAATAAIERVRAIHKVKHGEKPKYADDDYHAEREPVSWEKYSMCEGCSATWPCRTVAALDGAPEPEWEERTIYGSQLETGRITIEPRGPNYATHQRTAKFGPWEACK